MDLSKRTYSVFLASVGLWCAAIVAAPVLHAYGSPVGKSIADALYLGFSKICHQLNERSFHVCGAEFGVCMRCSSIYFSFLAGILLYPLVRPLNTKTVPDRRWILVAVLPMAIDALLNDLGIHQSNETTRVLTGVLAGFVFAFYMLPLLIDAVQRLLHQRNYQGEPPYAGQTQ